MNWTMSGGNLRFSRKCWGIMGWPERGGPEPSPGPFASAGLLTWSNLQPETLQSAPAQNLKHVPFGAGPGSNVGRLGREIDLAGPGQGRLNSSRPSPGPGQRTCSNLQVFPRFRLKHSPVFQNRKHTPSGAGGGPEFEFTFEFGIEFGGGPRSRGPEGPEGPEGPGGGLGGPSVPGQRTCSNLHSLLKHSPVLQKRKQVPEGARSGLGGGPSVMFLFLFLFMFMFMFMFMLEFWFEFGGGTSRLRVPEGPYGDAVEFD